MRYIHIPGKFCVYCGEIASTEEHFPPLTHHPEIGVVLPACRECNCMASAEHPRDFSSRARYVTELIERKYAKILCSPAWDENEMATLGRNLRAGVQACQRARKILIERVAWSAEMYLLSIDHCNDFARIVAGKPISELSDPKKSRRSARMCVNCERSFVPPTSDSSAIVCGTICAQSVREDQRRRSRRRFG